MQREYIIALVVGAFSISNAAEIASETNTINVKNLSDMQARESVFDWTQEAFGLTPYLPNYALLYGYNFGDKYKVYTPSDSNYLDMEAELQISFKFNLANNLLGLDESYYVAYTQRAFWQIYKKSSPFREINYSPEFFVTTPVGHKNSFGLKNVTFGFWHTSNGQGNIYKTDNVDKYPELVNRSRSLNRLYVAWNFQHQSLMWKIKAWYPLGNFLDDNPDIMDYYGYGSIRAMYFYKKHLLTAKLRGNPKTKQGALEMSYSYPGKVKGVYFFSKFFTGYGESMIDYNQKSTKISVGISFSR